MSVEWAYILLPPTGWALWAIGGTGHKWARRYGYPVVLAAVLFALGTPWWATWLTGISISFVAHLGYGDRTGWLMRWLVGLSYGSSVMPLAALRPNWMSWAILALAGSFVGLIWLTRRHNWLPHKIIEGTWGLLHATASIWLAA